jgi:UPF0755 protein
MTKRKKLISKKKSKPYNLTKSFRVIVFIAILAIFWVIFSWIQFLRAPLISSSEPVDLIFLPHSSVHTLAATLKKHGVSINPRFLILLARLKGVSQQLHAGEYVFEPGTTPSQLLDKMVRGDAVRHIVTIVEGWDFKQVLAAINTNPFLLHTLSGFSDAAIMEKVVAPGVVPEGNFAPDTYFFSGRVSDVAILRIAYNLMQKRLLNAWQNRDPFTTTIYKSPSQALIVASLIEKEVFVKSEKPEVAGVIIRRLQKRMPLQIDATVIYGLGGDYTKKLHSNDLLHDTRYNTYLHLGLPPTPIAMPGVDSIYGALHPAAGTALYYVAKGDGTHVFSDTLAEHDAAIRKYLLHK